MAIEILKWTARAMAVFTVLLIVFLAVKVAWLRATKGKDWMKEENLK